MAAGANATARALRALHLAPAAIGVGWVGYVAATEAQSLPFTYPALVPGVLLSAVLWSTGSRKAAGKWAVRVVSAGLLVLLVPAFLFTALICSMLVRNIDTQYASAYTEGAFNAVRVGDKRRRLTRLLGRPLEVSFVDHMGQTCEVLVYSRSPSSSHYHRREAYIDRTGRVALILKEFYWD